MTGRVLVAGATGFDHALRQALAEDLELTDLRAPLAHTS